MQLEPRPSSIAAALVYGAAAAFCAVSLWVVLTRAYQLDGSDRSTFLSTMQPVLAAWVVIGGFGLAFAICALRFAQLGVPLRRAVLVASCAVAVVAGVWLEWWQSLSFLFPAFVLAVAFRGVAHA